MVERLGSLPLWMLLYVAPSIKPLRWVAMETKNEPIFLLLALGPICTIAQDIFMIDLKLSTWLIMARYWLCHPISDEKTHLKSNYSRGCVTSRSKTQLGLETGSLAPKTKLGWSMKAEGAGGKSYGIHVDTLLPSCKASNQTELRRTHPLPSQGSDWWHFSWLQ